MNEILVAYTAGLFDGEGSVQINARKSKRKNGFKYYWYLTFQISSGDFATLEELRNSWNLGATTNWKPKKGKTSYNWRVYSDEAKAVMQTLLPYTKIKKEQLVLGVEFIGLSSMKVNGRLTKEMSEKRTEVALRLQAVNQRYGKSKLKLTKDVYNVCN